MLGHVSSAVEDVVPLVRARGGGITIRQERSDQGCRFPHIANICILGILESPELSIGAPQTTYESSGRRRGVDCAA